jgi:hypothetical protein
MTMMQKMGMGGVVLVGAIVLGFFLFFRSPLNKEAINSQENNGRDPFPLPLVEITQTRHADVVGRVGCDVRLLYPQITEESVLSNDVRDAINDAIVKQVKDFFSATSSSLDDAATAWTTECQADMAGMLEGADFADDPAASLAIGWASEIGYDVMMNDGTYFSIGLANALQTGGAHPNTTELFLTFDVSTGTVVTLRDIVPADQILSFEIAEKQWLIDTMEEFLFEESLQEFRDFIASPTQEQADRYCDDAIFYLTPTEYVTFYNPYTIAPYTTGPIEARLPR